MKKLFSIVSKLSAKRFAELHSDWPKLIFGSHFYSILCGERLIHYFIVIVSPLLEVIEI